MRALKITLAAAFLLTGVVRSEAVTYVVSSPLDEVGVNPGNGICETAPGNGVCTLRRAIYEANRVPGGGATIDLTTVPGGVVTLTIPEVDGDSELNGDLNITRSMQLVGAGPTATVIDANGAVTHSRALAIGGGLPAGDVVIAGLTLRNGAVDVNPIGPDVGGGLLVFGGAVTLANVIIENNATDLGGGVFLGSGSLTLNNTRVRNNTAAANGGGVFVFSGGSATLTIENSVISGNGAVNGAGVYLVNGDVAIVRSTITANVASGSGGGIATAPGSGSTVTLTSSTVSDNRANGDGGGLLLFNATASAFNSTIAENEVDHDLNGFGTGGGVFTYQSTFTFQNTILANNWKSTFTFPEWIPTRGDCDGTLTSAGFNLMRVLDCTVSGPAPVVADPLLGPLAPNGAATPTHALLVGSPAIDGGDPAGCEDADGAVLGTDQRRFRRAAFAVCDIGAFEAGASAPVRAGSFDLSGDGQADLVWRHRVFGANAAWQMDGAAIEAAAMLPADPVTTHHIVGVDDFDGDGKADLLWHDATAHESGIWFMDGLTVRDMEGLQATPEGADCRVAGTGDFNADTRADVLWECGGRSFLWLLDGADLQAAPPLPVVGEPGWNVVSTGDLDGDGVTDVVWRHADGRNAYWRIVTGAIDTGVLMTAVAEPGWEIAGAGDVSGDGGTDLVWRNQITGQNAVWIMDGADIAAAAFLPTVPLDWTVEGVVDFDGDGQADVVWRSQGGENALWLMDGTAIAAASMLTPVPDTGWEIQPQD